jgi:hypothetical protein
VAPVGPAIVPVGPVDPVRPTEPVYPVGPVTVKFPDNKLLPIIDGILIIYNNIN